MNYKQAVDYIEETPKFTTKNSLDHTKECLRRLGSPQERFWVIHVAGTNGKGSTCAFLASVLKEAGISCGLFTSPHLVEITERFQIQEEPVSREKFLEAFHKVKEMVDALVAEGIHHPTYFEMLFLMGMVIFADAGVDYVMLETGLGGRMDATTSIENPLACVITSVSLDHMQYLGNTVEEIAGEKAGIIVPGVPVIYDGNDPRTAQVIREKAKGLESPCYEVRQSQCRIVKNTPEGIDFIPESPYYEGNTFHIPFLAVYQVMNAALALTALEVLKEDLPLERAVIQRGISKTRWQGRMETILPGVIVDGAHNEDGVKKFVETAAHFCREYTIGILFSAVADKDYQDMAALISREIRPDYVITTQIEGERVVPAGTLAQEFERQGCADAIGIPCVEEAFDRACAKMTEKTLLFCVGSLYLVGEIKRYVRRKTND